MSKLKISPLSGSIGAQVQGIDLGAVDSDTFATIKEAFLQYCMLVFRDQDIDEAEQVAFGKMWGEPSVTPMLTYIDGFPGLREQVNIGKDKTPTENWHYDSTFMERPPAITMLAAKVLPPYGGDTMWCNQYLAYDALSDGMKKMIGGLRVKFVGTRLARIYNDGGDVPFAYHPMVRSHPETGRKALFVGHPETAMEIENMTAEEGRVILDYLYAHSPKPDRTYRHVWQTGDVLMWDNRCTMHYAVHDYGSADRVMHRMTIEGDVPV